MVVFLLLGFFMVSVARHYTAMEQEAQDPE